MAKISKKQGEEIVSSGILYQFFPSKTVEGTFLSRTVDEAVSLVQQWLFEDDEKLGEQ